jgi:hypothetical protein
MCVRIRMTFGNGGEDFTERAWRLNRVGIWYGSWLPDDLYNAYGDERPVVAVQVAQNLNEIMAARGTACSISESGVSTSRRFDDLPVGEWVFVYFGRKLHFAQIADGTLHCAPDIFSVNEELFKYKTVHNQKSFALAELPEPFMLLAPAGRSNVHHVVSCEGLVKMLRDSADSGEVRRRFSEMGWDEWLAALGPKGWESLCTGFLIVAHGYLPSGLAIGGTLADFDIVGSLGSGEAVFAQCKNDRGQRKISEADFETFRGLEAAQCFYFAYGGVDREIPGVVHINGHQIVKWLEEDPLGRSYKQRLRSSRLA